MDLTTVFCDIDDFCSLLYLEAPTNILATRAHSHRLKLSKVLTILLMSHHSWMLRDFKGYYTQKMIPD